MARRKPEDASPVAPALLQVATRRSEFAAILKSEGIDGLIAALNRKADTLTGTSAEAF